MLSSVITDSETLNENWLVELYLTTYILRHVAVGNNGCMISVYLVKVGVCRTLALFSLLVLFFFS